MMIFSCSLLNAMAIADVFLTTKNRTESLNQCKLLKFDPLTNQSKLSDDLCLLKWCLAMTATAVAQLFNLVLDVSFHNATLCP